MKQQRRGFSTLFGFAIALSATACSAPVQRAPKVAAVPRAALASSRAAVSATSASVASSAPIVEPAPAAVPAPITPPTPNVAGGAGPSANEIIARVQTVYDKVNAVKFSFKQRYAIAAYSSLKDSTGSVIAEKPSQSSWRYSNGNRVVIAGGLVQVYERDNERLYKAQASKVQFLSAVSFTFGAGKLERLFAFTKQDAQRMKYPSGFVVSGDPLQPSTAVKRVFFYVDGQTYFVRRVLFVDAQGNRNRYDFLKTELGVRIPPDEFHLEVPPGTQIFEP